ncbi:hypothetical protein DL95DRAFT_399772 [Leptodontidium sp. 2 PMI_412]|nr:hypothetical protein BKA61DRAFT_578989 [Leptodontidium sp. MPI-SDFR-AT-0119]KAH9224432.1 hypothetical protein DL95DRAFT_399772 [Leptodontidium sp. 2 PMI_412]
MTSESRSPESPETMPETEIIPIPLATMPQHDKFLREDDNWMGKSNPAERRKRQNRINQREYRKRKEIQNNQNASPLSLAGSSSPPSSKFPGPNHDPNRDSKVAGCDSGIWEIFHSAAACPRFDMDALSRTATLCKSTSTQNQRILSELENWIISNRHLGSPCSDQLLVLVKFNVFRALISNSTTLAFHAENVMNDDALSPFNSASIFQNFTLAIPLSLHPTELQCQIPHHPWIDLLPIPRMRDNLLRAGDSYDDIELCGDLVGFFNSPIARTGMVIWGDPWDVDGWEVTEPFLERWGWTIRGCGRLFESTNRWREKRGERPLRFDRLICDDSGS